MTRAELQREAERVIAQIDTFYDRIYAILYDWSVEVSQEFEQLKSEFPISDSRLASLVEQRSVEILTQTELPIYGAGFCASERVVEHGNPLAWWQGPDTQPLASSTFGVGPGAVDLRRLEWYRTPELTGEAVIAGPFVDYLCSNEVTLTASLPVTLHDEFTGVLCIDVLVSTFERVFGPSISTTPHVTIMNRGRRVVISSDVELNTGDRVNALRVPEAGATGSPAGVAYSAEYPFVVLVEPSASQE